MAITVHDAGWGCVLELDCLGMGGVVARQEVCLDGGVRLGGKHVCGEMEFDYASLMCWLRAGSDVCCEPVHRSQSTPW